MSNLEEQWEDIEDLLRELGNEPYIDDQVELDEIWSICADLVENGDLESEDWSLRRRFIIKILKHDLYCDYSVDEPMQNLLIAMCVSPEEKEECAVLAEEAGDPFVRSGS